ncbi:hypothetical protein HanOQP8_Chr06g0228361 [Helianthus annuus]|nr:hypothetical protein HanHA89_Chr06g0235991 [Helianthus annuus]KAJ0738582.1 hypothetical protein HanLR1_Chr06g0219921 [Helianthus annuus]KAJ0741465.1 hypothetical protein HanOQP8_Chr06g0228361 [Helianthus annuus]
MSQTNAFRNNTNKNMKPHKLTVGYVILLLWCEFGLNFLNLFGSDLECFSQHNIFHGWRRGKQSVSHPLGARQLAVEASNNRSRNFTVVYLEVN